MSERTRMGALSPFSTRPFSDIQAEDNLPYLSGEMAALSMAIGGITAFGVVLQVLLKVDPWAVMFWYGGRMDFYVVGTGLLFVLTALIAYKQICYYYNSKGTHKKHGIFVSRIRQVNPREQILDFIISVVGGVFVVSAITLPVIWFLMMAIFSVSVVFRCYVTLKRRVYLRRLREEGIEIPRWYDRALDTEYKGLVVKYVLAGWVVSQTLAATYSLLVFLFFYYHFDLFSSTQRIIFLVSVLVGLYLLWYHLSERSYDWGKKIALRIDVDA